MMTRYSQVSYFSSKPKMFLDPRWSMQKRGPSPHPPSSPSWRRGERRSPNAPNPFMSPPSYSILFNLAFNVWSHPVIFVVIQGHFTEFLAVIVLCYPASANSITSHNNVITAIFCASGIIRGTITIVIFTFIFFVSFTHNFLNVVYWLNWVVFGRLAWNC